MIFKNCPSPYYEERVPESKIEFLILHYTACDCATALRLFSGADPQTRVSAHYLIDENGDVYNLVAEEYRAWHAGKSYWGGITDINSHSIGIELVNPGQGNSYRAFPSAQMNSLRDLSQEIIHRHPIPPYQVLGHSDIAVGRKIDPGPLFDWRWLAEQGIGLYPPSDLSLTSSESISHDPCEIQKLLKKYGYEIELTGVWDKQTHYVLQAFGWHFMPNQNPEKNLLLLATILEWLIEKIN